MKNKYINLMALMVVLILSVSGELFSSELSDEVIKKGKISYHGSAFIPYFRYENEPDKKHIAGIFLPSRITKAVSQVPDAKAQLEKANIKIIESYTLSVPAGFLLGLSSVESDYQGAYLAGGIVATIISFVNIYVANQCIQKGVDIYNQEIDKKTTKISQLFMPKMISDEAGIKLASTVSF